MVDLPETLYAIGSQPEQREDRLWGHLARDFPAAHRRAVDDKAMSVIY